MARWREALAEWTVPSDETEKASADSWARLADLFRRLGREFRPESDPFICRLDPLLNPNVTVLEVGAGAGRFTIPMAKRAGRVIAVEPSLAMRAVLAEELAQNGLRNVEIIPGTWPDVDVSPVDIAVCANVFYDVAELGPFLRRLDAVAVNACFVYLTANHPLAAMRDLWLTFRNWNPPCHPTYLDAAGCMYQLGIHCDVELENIEAWSYSDVEEAVAEVRRRLGLAALLERDAALREYLIERGRWKDARWVPHYSNREVAILSWRRNHSTSGDPQNG